MGGFCFANVVPILEVYQRTGAAPKQPNPIVTWQPPQKQTNLSISLTNLEQALWWCNLKFLSRDLLDGQVLWIAQLSSSRARAQAQLETKHASANSAGGEEAFQQKLSDRTSRQTLVDFWNLSDFILMGVFDNWLPSCLTYSLSLNLPISNSKQNIFWKTSARIIRRRSRLKAWSFLLTPKRKL